MRRTKIIATLGPACNSEDTVYRLLTHGVDVFRLNFSHGTPEEHERTIKTVREAAMAVGRYVPIVGDIQGPKIRIGDVDGVTVDAELIRRPRAQRIVGRDEVEHERGFAAQRHFPLRKG